MTNIFSGYCEFRVLDGRQRLRSLLPISPRPVKSELGLRGTSKCLLRSPEAGGVGPMMSSLPSAYLTAVGTLDLAESACRAMKPFKIESLECPWYMLDRLSHTRFQ